MTLFSRRGLGLSGAFVIAVVIAVMGRVGGTDQSNVIPTPGRRATATAGSTATVPVDDVKLELLQKQHRDQGEAQRNPFRFEVRTPPAPAVRPEAPRPSPIAPPLIVPTGPPPPPPIPLRFIGLVDAPTQAGRVAILSDGRGNIFYGKDGAVIEGRYKVLKIGPDAAELSYLDGRGRQTIRLTGQ